MNSKNQIKNKLNWKLNKSQNKLKIIKISDYPFNKKVRISNLITQINCNNNNIR